MKNDTQRSQAPVFVSRRQFLGTAAAAATGLLLPGAHRALAFGRVLDIEGVKIGAISYSYRSLPGSAEEVLSYLLQAGMDTVELMGEVAEGYAGAPTPPPFPAGPRPAPGQPSPAMEAFRAAREAYNQEARAWRDSVDSLDRFEALGKRYREAGVTIDILKLGNPDWPDAHIDYAFQAAKAVGARGISMEISNETAERMGPFATKHQLLVGLHNHTQVGDEGFSFDVPLSYSPYNSLNLDIGHYVAGTNESPIPVIQKYHDRISHLHLKDRKKGLNGGDNVPWGEGDTPIAETLQLLKKERYPISAMIELEYPIPEGSDVHREMKKCVEYCRKALA